MTILQYEDWNDTWRVHVRWALPAQAPSLYEVTLRTNKSTQAVTIPGVCVFFYILYMACLRHMFGIVTAVVRKKMYVTYLLFH